MNEWKPGPRRNLFVRVLAGIVAAVVVVAGVLTYRSCVPGVTFTNGRAFAATLEPVSADALGVAPNSAFTLKLAQPVPLAAVRSALSVEPQVDLAVKAADREGKVFTVSPEKPLEPDRVYRFLLALAGPGEPGYSWAFQVAGEFRVVGSLPGDRATGVPLNTGIELTFSHDGASEPGPYFSIQPFVPGHWERHRRTLVYVPAAPLQPATVYTCTVKKGLGLEGSSKTLAADYTFAFETAEAAPASSPTSWFYIDTSAAEFGPGEPPFFSVNYGQYGGGSDTSTPPKVACKVYRYRDAAAYIAAQLEREKVPYWAYLSRRAWIPPTAGLQPVLDAEIALQTYQWQSYLVLPQALDPGFYLVRFTHEGTDYYIWVQVTDLSAYTLEAVNDTVLWFNSLAAGGPAAGVTVRAADSGVPLGSSNADGLVRFTTPEKLRARDDPEASYEPLPPYYVTARAPDGSELVLDLSPYYNAYGARLRRPDLYWSYLYADRPLYLPDDEVCFWGVLEPRERGAAEVTRVQVELRSSYGLWEGPFGGASHGSGLISSTEVEVRRHTFQGRVKLPNLRPGTYYLALTLQGATLTSRYFDVATYTKPAYRITLTADKKAVFAGQPVTFGLDAAFFEGTPVPDLKLNYSLSSGETNLSGVLTTDVTGHAALSYTPQAGSFPLILERQDWLAVNAQLPESGPIWAQTGVRVFEKDVALRASVSPDPGGAKVEVRLNKVTLDRINGTGPGAGPGSSSQPAPQTDIPDYQGDPVARRDVTGQVYEVRWDAHETGQYYDFVAKVTRKIYDYTEVKVPVGTFTVTTDSDGRASWVFPADPAKSYFVRLECRDDAARTVASELYFYGSAYVGRDEGYHFYHLVPTDRERARYAVGETVAVELKDDRAAVKPRAKSFLFYKARLGLGQVELRDEPGFSFTFAEDLIPNTTVQAVYFDGRYYNDAPALTAAFDYSGRELRVAVRTDKDSYAPGDKVRLTVEVTDSQGQPVGAEVNLSAVDEALYQAAEQLGGLGFGQKTDLLDSLYGRMVPTYFLLDRGTHYRRLVGGAGAESGGEGGGVRDNFVDNALFTSLTTGPDGKGSVEMTLPDNLTSWRLTYQAFASGVRAGSGSITIAVRLPFFVELSMNETYLAGDSPVVPARAYGAALPPGTAVTFTGKLVPTGAGGAAAEPSGQEAGREPGPSAGQDLAPVTGVAFRPSNLPLGVLERGGYTLTVTGRAVLPDGRVLEDSLARTIEVPETYLRLDRVDYYQVGEGLRVKAEPGEPATLIFSDQERGPALRMLWRLLGGGSRVDMKAAAVAAHRLLTRYFGFPEEALGPAPTTSELMSCQQPDGGVGLLPYAGSDLELTAKVAALERADDVGLDREGLASYLGRVYDDRNATRERLIVALYGLAALGEPVLTDLQRLAAEPDLSVKEKLYAALGLIELGDEEAARGLFAGVLGQYGDRIGRQLRLDVSRDQEEIIAATSLGAVIAARLGMEERDALLSYLEDNVPWEELNLLELALYLEAVVPGAPAEPVSFTLQPEGKTVSLKAGETYSCYKTAEDLAQLGFSDVHGKVGLSVFYRSPVDLGRVKDRGGQVTVKRSYQALGREGKTGSVFGPTDVVKVVLTYTVSPEAPEGPYQIVDFLPAGLKAVPRPRDLGVDDPKVTYPVEVDGQKVTFNVYLEPGPVDPKTGRPKPRGGSGTAVYYARVVSPGQYRADPAVVVHVRTGEIFAVSDRGTIEIKGVDQGR